MASLIVIPAADYPTYDRLKAIVKNELNEWLKVVNRVCCMVDALGAIPSFQAVAEEFGKEWRTVKGKYYAALKKGWRGLVNKRRLGEGSSKLSEPFIQYWHGLVLSNQRNTAKAWDRFREQYRGGTVIPGMPAPAEREGRMPRGVTLRNLRRKMPPKASVVMARQGIAAARAFLPHGPQDISLVRPLEWIVFDDVELDFLIVVPGCKTPVKLRLLVAMDLCSRMILGYGVRPAITREDGKEDSLKLRDMKALVARFLRTWGVPVEYIMNFVVERATAALPDAEKTALAEISGGRIVVHDTSMVVGQVFEFKDKASGNSWGKAWLESFFNSLHNELQDLPGQKGRRYDLAPAELEGRRQELAKLVRAGKRLPLELRYEFRWPFLTGAEALQELDAALARLNQRTDHGLLCFDKVGLWRMNESDKPKTAAEMPDWLLPNSAQLLWETRMEMPVERFQRLFPEDREMIADSSLARLMDEHKQVRFGNLQFAFEREDVDYIYLPPDALLPLLKEGDSYLLWFHPDHMGTVYVTRDRPHLGYVGKLERFTAGRRGDLEAAKDYLREKQRLFAHAQRAAQQTKIGDLYSRAEDLAENTEVIREGLAQIEKEVMPAEAQRRGGSEILPDSIGAMNADREATATEEARERVDLVKETLARPVKAREDASDVWA